MHPFIYIDGFPFAVYSLMGIFGYTASIVLVLIKRRAFRFCVRDVLQFAVFAAIGILGGARILSVIVKMVQLGHEPGFWGARHLLDLILKSGWVFYGGLLGGFGMLFLLAKLRHMNRNNIFNAYVYVALTFVSVARLGCFFTGCCYGITLSHGTRLPVQLFESGFCFAVLVAFLIVRPERRWPGLPLFPVFLTIYSVGRFMLEFLRGDASRGVWILSTSQWIALVLITISVIWIKKSGFSLRSNKSKKQKAQGVVRL